MFLFFFCERLLCVSDLASGLRRTSPFFQKCVFVAIVQKWLERQDVGFVQSQRIILPIVQLPSLCVLAGDSDETFSRC